MSRYIRVIPNSDYVDLERRYQQCVEDLVDQGEYILQLQEQLSAKNKTIEAMAKQNQYLNNRISIMRCGVGVSPCNN